MWEVISLSYKTSPWWQGYISEQPRAGARKGQVRPCFILTKELKASDLKDLSRFGLRMPLFAPFLTLLFTGTSVPGLPEQMHF